MFITLFLVGLALVLVGASGLVNTASVIARKAKISPLIIGITAVALGTSLPEIAVSFFGGVDNATQLAIGNIIGSNIANIGLILSITILFGSIKIGRYKTQRNISIYFILTIVSFLILITGKLNFLSGLLFIIFGIVILLWQIMQGKKGALIEDKALFQKVRIENKNPLLIGLSFILSLAALVAGGKLLVDYGVLIANTLGIPQAVIGLTLVAIGTSLPELAVSIVGFFKHEEKLVVGNILGSNIFNLLFGGGILGLYSVGNLNSNITIISFLLFSLAFSLMLYVYRGKIIPRYLGVIFLLSYIGYVLLIIT